MRERERGREREREKERERERDRQTDRQSTGGREEGKQNMVNRKVIAPTSLCIYMYHLRPYTVHVDAHVYASNANNNPNNIMPF